MDIHCLGRVASESLSIVNQAFKPETSVIILITNKVEASTEIKFSAVDAKMHMKDILSMMCENYANKISGFDFAESNILYDTKKSKYTYIDYDDIEVGQAGGVSFPYVLAKPYSQFPLPTGYEKNELTKNRYNIIKIYRYNFMEFLWEQQRKLEESSDILSAKTEIERAIDIFVDQMFDLIDQINKYGGFTREEYETIEKIKNFLSNNHCTIFDIKAILIQLLKFRDDSFLFKIEIINSYISKIAKDFMQQLDKETIGAIFKVGMRLQNEEVIDTVLDLIHTKNQWDLGVAIVSSVTQYSRAVQNIVFKKMSGYPVKITAENVGFMRALNTANTLIAADRQALPGGLFSSRAQDILTKQESHLTPPKSINTPDI